MRTRPKNSTAPNDAQSAREAALALLARREHTALELRHKLTQRGFSADTIVAALAQLDAGGWLSDARFADIYARSRADKGYGPLRIQSELRERGVTADTVRQVLAELTDFWQARLAELHRKRFGAVPDSLAERAKQMRFLRQRGFTLDQINQLFRHR